MMPSEYAALYPPAPPLPKAGHVDTKRQLGPDDGVGSLPECVAYMPRAAVVGSDDARHLWVIVPQGVPVILETAPEAKPPLVEGKAKHTNLTGGRPACCGGEMWADPVATRLLHLNGGSGRYGARTPQQLDDAVRVVESFGFDVRSAGWSDENDCPQRVFR